MESYKEENIQKPNHSIYYTIPYLILILLSIKSVYSRYISFGFVLLFLLVFFIVEKKIVIKKKYVYFICFIVGYGLLGVLHGELMQIIKNICMFILNFAPFFIFDWVFSPNRKDRRLQNSKLLIKVMTPMLIYTVISTLYYLHSNPYIARNMANYDPSLGTTTDMPIAIGGGYVLIYGIILVPPVLLYLAKYNKLIVKLMCLIIAVFLLYFIVKSGFATAFIISTAGCLLAITLKNKQKVLNRILLTSAIAIISILFLNVEMFSGIINSITNVLPDGSIIAIRLNEIIPTLYGFSNAPTSFSMRLNNLDITINAFIENPMLGVGYRLGFDYVAVSAITGLHTEWLDNLSQYGVLLGIPYLMFFGISLKELSKSFRSTHVEIIVNIVIVMIIALGFLNPIITSSAFLIAMVYIPCLLLIFSKESK